MQIFLTILLTVLAVLNVRGSDDLVMSADGIQCNSCGAKCSLVCGSRQFKFCCLNFVKRSYPSIPDILRRHIMSGGYEANGHAWIDPKYLSESQRHWNKPFKTETANAAEVLTEDSSPSNAFDDSFSIDRVDHHHSTSPLLIDLPVPLGNY